MLDIFQYPDLPLDQKVQMERRILNRPFEYRLSEYQHLLATSFPFGPWDRGWLERYCELAEYKAEKGHLRVRRESSLGRWVSHQRDLRRKGKLLPDKMRALNRLGFSWAPVEEHWQEQYDAYRKYAAAEQPGSASRSLIGWASIQRHRWNRLSERQRKLLSQVGISQDPFGEGRAKNLLEMESHFRKRGNLVGLSIRLNKFSEAMRRFQASGKLDPTYKARLDRLNFKWVIPRQTVDPSTLWKQRYAQVAAYLEPMLPHVPSLRDWDNPTLAKWVDWQRQTKCWQRLPLDRQKKLAALNLAPGTVQLLKWNAHYEKAVAIKKKMKPSTVGAYKSLDRTVYRWLRGQQERRKNLSPWQRQRLRKLGMDVSTTGPKAEPPNKS